MKKILLLSTSSRAKGNGETTLQLCAKNISEEFDVEFLNLNNFKLDICTGCMKCAATKSFCHIKDDLKILIDKIQEADLLFISAPVYFLGAASQIKILIDRLLYMHNIIDFKKEKKAGIVLTYGRVGWEGDAMQQVSTLLLALGFKINDVLRLNAQGPAEILLDEKIERKVKAFTYNVINALKPVRQTNCCSICYSNSFIPTGITQVKCSICNINGTIVNFVNGEPVIVFEYENNRWNEENIKHHMESWVEDSTKTYKEKIREIMKKRKEYFKHKN